MSPVVLSMRLTRLKLSGSVLKAGPVSRLTFNNLRASCSIVVHDLGSAEPRSRVEPSSR